MQRQTWIRSLVWKDPLEEGMATHSTILAWGIPWTEELGGLHTVHGVSKESDTTEWLTHFLSLNMVISLLLDHMAIFFLKLGLASIKPHVQRARQKRFSQRKREHKFQGSKSSRWHGNIPTKSGQPQYVGKKLSQIVQFLYLKKNLLAFLKGNWQSWNMFTVCSVMIW